MFQIDPKRLKHFDFLLFSTVLLISGLGVLTISVTASGSAFAIKQVVWIFIGVLSSLILYNVDTRYIKRNAVIIYALVIFLLVLVFANGIISHGARRWISIYFLHLQPSEFVKLAIIIVLAAYFDESPKPEPYELKDLIVPFILVLLPVVFIVKQPDLGTAIVIGVISLSIILAAGIDKSLLFKMILVFLVFLPFAWSKLQPYQKDRIMGFLDPYKAPTTYGYNTIQSEIAIGSGGLFGKGLHHATQTQLSFLPESHTDFIFSVFAEQWGFVGCLILIFLYGVVLARAVYIAANSQNDFDILVSVGIIAYLWISVVFNMGMAMGLLPVVGIPLVFFSYGGSSIITSFLAVGILLSVEFRNRV